MKIINLTQTQYKNYANIHSYRNIGQTVEYTRLQEIKNNDKLFLGLIDETNILHAAVCIVIHNISPMIKEAIAKDGFLIDYNNYELLEIFVNNLTNYLKKYNITCLKTDPKFKYKVYNKKNVLIENNEHLLDNFIRLNFKNNGFQNEFEKYDILIENYHSKEDIYNRFNRNTKRNIKDSINIGITLHKAKPDELKHFYDMIKKKKNNSFDYYQNMLTAYNTPDNKMEIFFAKINVEKFLIKSKKLYDKEKNRNDDIHKTINNHYGKISTKIYNKKLNSDRLLNKYHTYLKLATELNLTEKKEIIVGTSAIIRNNIEIYFLIDGYSEKYRYIHSSDLLKWGIIEKFYQRGYNKFNLGEVHQLYYSKVNKFHGQYLHKIGFGGNIIEYPPEMILIINKPLYEASKKINNFFQKK